jgi:hypothetical protein
MRGKNVHRELEPVLSILRVQWNSDSLGVASSTYENEQVAEEHAVLDDLTAAILSTADTHFVCEIKPKALINTAEVFTFAAFDARCGFSCVVQVLIIFTMATEPSPSLLAKHRNESGMAIVRLVKVEAFDISWRNR